MFVFSIFHFHYSAYALVAQLCQTDIGRTEHGAGLNEVMV